MACLNCGLKTPLTHNHTGARDFCNDDCEAQWRVAQRLRGGNIGINRHDFVAIHETKKRARLLTAAIKGDKKSRRILRREYRLLVIWDGKKEVRLC